MVRSLAMDMEPDVGVYSPTIIFSRVVLPVPLAPIRPIFSPGLICQLASSYNALAPISNVRLFIAIICAQRYGFEAKGGKMAYAKRLLMTNYLLLIKKANFAACTS